MLKALVLVPSLIIALSAPLHAQEQVVGVIENYYWGGNYADPMDFVMRVSTANKNIVAMLMMSSAGQPLVEFDFRIYDYDPAAKVYYRSVHSDDAALYGMVDDEEGELAWSIGSEPAGDVTSPVNYMFTVSLAPQEEEQVVQMAVSAENKFAKQWGVTVMGKKTALARAARTAAAVAKPCDVENGFDFSAADQTTVGYVMSMKIDGINLDPEFMLATPEDGGVPVELASFTAVRGTGGVALAWRTASEQGNLGFNVERSSSIDGPFERVNTALIAGAVNSAVPVGYSFTDTYFPAGELWYRLQQVDVDGGATYSPIIVCDDGSAAVPMRVSGAGKTGSLPEYVMTLDGRAVRTAGAAPGVYLVREGGAVRRYCVVK